MRRGVGGAAKSGAGEGRGGLSDGPNLIPAPNVLEMPAWSGAEAAGRYPLEMMDRTPPASGRTTTPTGPITRHGLNEWAGREEMRRPFGSRGRAGGASRFEFIYRNGPCLLDEFYFHQSISDPFHLSPNPPPLLSSRTFPPPLCLPLQFDALVPRYDFH